MNDMKRIFILGCTVLATMVSWGELSYSAIRSRFPDLQLPETPPAKIVAVTTASELIEAVEVATEHTVLCLSGEIELTEPLSLNAQNTSASRLTLVGMTSSNTFVPALLTGNPLTVEAGVPVDLANLEITQITNNTATIYGALTIGQSAEARLSSVTFHNLEVARSACGVLGTAFFSNVTIGENCTTTYAGSAPLWVMKGTAHLTHCTIMATDGETIQNTSGTITCANVLLETSNTTYDGTCVSPDLTWVSTPGQLSHAALTSNSIAIDSVTTTIETLPLDALGQSRPFGKASDYGAVEYHADATITIPEDLVVLPSGQRQVYIGWSPIGRATHYRVEKSLDDGTTWHSLPEDVLLWQTPTSMEATSPGWQSVRYLDATPGQTASYRLAVSADNEQTWTYASPTKVTTPKPLIERESLPGAPQTIYLDFSGHIDDYHPHVAIMQSTFAKTYPDLAANAYITIPPFFFRGGFANPAEGTTALEVYPLNLAVEDIWRMVAEDFAIFNVNVTTVEPPYAALVKSSTDDMQYGKRVIFDPAYDMAANKAQAWHLNAGGQSCLGSFGFRADRPVYIFGSASRQGLAAQATHEITHTLGLTHDSGQRYFNGTFAQMEYYGGVPLTPSNLCWYPIQGAVPTPIFYNLNPNDPDNVYLHPYDSDDFINQFSNGNYSSATNTEDDIAIILGLITGPNESTVIQDDKAELYPPSTRSLFLRDDDAGDTLATAKPLFDDDASTWLNATTTFTGRISKHINGTTLTPDIDVYTFTLPTRKDFTLTFLPSYQGKEEGASLIAYVELLSEDGTSIVTAYPNATATNPRHVTLTHPALAPGKYAIRVTPTYLPFFLNTAPEDATEMPWSPNAKDAYGSVGPYQFELSFETPQNAIGYLLRLQ